MGIPIVSAREAAAEVAVAWRNTASFPASTGFGGGFYDQDNEDRKQMERKKWEEDNADLFSQDEPWHGSEVDTRHHNIPMIDRLTRQRGR